MNLITLTVINNGFFFTIYKSYRIPICAFI